MQKDGLDEAYNDCCSKGLYIHKSKINIEKIKSMMEQVNSDFLDLKKMSEIQYSTPSVIFKTYYDILHRLVQIFLLFDGIKSINHDCMFVYICKNHKKLGFDWNTIDNIRHKRNDDQYYTIIMSFNEWNNLKPIIIRYMDTLKKEITKKMIESR